jgi:hypothetical protein
MVAIVLSANPEVHGQVIDRLTPVTSPAPRVALLNHHPQWANKENSTGLVAPDFALEQLTLVLSRSAQQEEDLQAFLAQQQDPRSPNYHRWLTPAEMGQRFGVSEQDVATLSAWLQSQGLHVNWVSPSRMFLRFGGTASAVGHAFQTELHNYTTSRNGTERMSVSSDPMIPLALKPAIKAIHGLYTVEDHPLHFVRPAQSDVPNTTLTNDEHVMVPGDFSRIYNYNGGSGTQPVAIGVVGRSRTDFNDFANFRQLTEANFANPTEIVPTQFGGIDPGPALTAPPGTGVSVGDQAEATLDVGQVGGLLGGNASILLVVATSASGGVEADAQYLVQTSPVPAQVMSISFGACESAAGPAAVAFWDTLIQQAAAEGISVLVSSGDSGASGCDEAFAAPPASPLPNSPNYICSTSYATCVGGTEFNDTADPTQYWNTTNNPGLSSALGYIPEGAWNEPLNAANGSQVAASGGGVSSVIATPAWQTGTGVPSARTGRYTPDVAFSASDHDGYLGCFAAGGGSCVTGANGATPFVVFSGTSAAAPLMAGIAGLAVEDAQGAQGNLNPQLYQLAANTPAAFHDVTVGSSGVINCALATPSMCNNSIPGATAQSGAQAGYLVTAGYDQVTGLGSLNISNFLIGYQGPPNIRVTPQSLTFSTELVGYPVSGSVSLGNVGSAPLAPLSFAITGANAADFTLPDNNCESALATGGTCAKEVVFTPSADGLRTANLTITSANAGNSPRVIPLSGTGTTTLYTPTLSATPSPDEINPAQAVTVTVLIGPPPGAPTTSAGAPILPTGSVILTGGGYTSSVTKLTGSHAIITIPAGSLGLGNIGFTTTYTPDSAASLIYTSASVVSAITVMPPDFIIEANWVTTRPGAAGATTIVAIAPTYGFIGSITLSAAVTSGPANAQHPPTLSFANSTVNITNAAAGGSTLTVSTTAPTANIVPAHPNRISWYLEGGASLAWVLMLGIPKRSRRWRSMLGMVLLLISLSGATMACGGSGGGSGSGSGTGSGTGTSSTSTGDPGTTPGTYVVTITGTSGSTTATCTLNVIVQ